MTDVRLLQVPIRAQRYVDAIEALIGAADGTVTRRAHFCTVHTLVESTRNSALHTALASAWMVCMDGVPLVWMSRLRGVPAQRVCGPDVMLTLCDRGRERDLRHYFLGGKPGTPENLAAALTSRFPGLSVVGTHAPPFRPMSDLEDAALVEDINAAKPDVVWVGLGSPKQELWAAKHEALLQCRLILPVGAAFDFHSGRRRRAPRWARRYGLEWLFRLAMEPRRLFRRYLMTNLRFVALIGLEEGRRRVGWSRRGD